MPNSSIICVDANLVVNLIDYSGAQELEDLFTGWIGRGIEIVAPYLMRYEVTNAIRRLLRHGQISQELAGDAIHTLVELPISLFTDGHHHVNALMMSSRFNLPATYDAHYLALAEELDCEFWTADRRLARAVRDELDWVHLFE